MAFHVTFALQPQAHNGAVKSVRSDVLYMILLVAYPSSRRRAATRRPYRTYIATSSRKDGDFFRLLSADSGLRLATLPLARGCALVRASRTRAPFLGFVVLTRAHPRA